MAKRFLKNYFYVLLLRSETKERRL